MKEYIKTAIISCIASFLFFNYILSFGHAASSSMSPTIEAGDFIVINKLPYKLFDKPDRKDIIAFYSQELNELVGKRIIGIEGDKIEFKDGYVYVNGAKQIENYTNGCTYKNEKDVYIVPEDCVFVLGDNREISYDSRYFNEPFINVKDIKGRIIYIF